MYELVSWGWLWGYVMALGATVEFVKGFVGRTVWPPHHKDGVADTALMGPVRRPSE